MFHLFFIINEIFSLYQNILFLKYFIYIKYKLDAKFFELPAQAMKLRVFIGQDIQLDEFMS